MSTLICNNRFAIPSIDLDECIGLSLNKINKNFQDLRDENCLTFDELNLIQNNLNTLSANFIQLSSFEFVGAYPKAWVNFNGTTTVPTICSVYSISGVNTVSNITRISTGTYSLSFTKPFSNTNYCLIGSSTLSGSFVQPISANPFTTTTATINIRNLSGVLVDSEYISIAAYSL